MTPEGHTFVESVQHLEDTSQTFLALPKGPRWGPHRRSGHPSTSLMVDSGAGLRVRARGEWRRGRLWLLRRLTWSLAADLLVVSEFAEKPTSGSRQVRLQARRRPRSEEEWDSWAFAWGCRGSPRLELRGGRPARGRGRLHRRPVTAPPEVCFLYCKLE